MTEPAMKTSDTCGHTTAEGGSCRSQIGLCEECGHCLSHCDHRAELRKRARSKGGKSARGGDVFLREKDALPRPETLQDCALWLSTLAWAVTTGKISDSRADKARLAVKDLRDLLLRDQEDKVDELRKVVDRLKRDRKGR